MSDTPTDRDDPSVLLERSIEQLERAQADGTVSEREVDAIKKFLDGLHPRRSTTKPEGMEHKSIRTLREYCTRLRSIARRLDEPLPVADADAINQLWDDMATGRHPDVKDDGLSANTLNGYQSSTRKFYEFHEYDVAKSDIAMVAPEESSVDPREMLAKDEIDAIRNEVDNPRDKCVVDLLLYTGQRVRAVQTLRIKDINLDDGSFYLNTDAGGLKGADGKRPLLAAEAAVRDWLEYHPNADTPNARLLTHRPEYRKHPDPEDTITQRTINRLLKDLADEAGVDKPVNAHQWRHNFVTICKREYGLDDSHVKALIGHRSDSQVMETTYSHLSDEDHKQAAEVAFGMREPEDNDDKTFAFDTCPTCNSPLEAGSVACSSCGTMLSPDANNVKDTVEDDMFEAKGEAPSGSKEEDAVDMMRRVLNNNPELVKEALDE